MQAIHETSIVMLIHNLAAQQLAAGLQTDIGPEQDTGWVRDWLRALEWSRLRR
jgi:hypothetical protein